MQSLGSQSFKWIAIGCLVSTLVACGGSNSGDVASVTTPATTLTGLEFQPSTVAASGESITTETIKSFDGTPIVATVFRPNLAAGEVVPLLLHSHGFGGTRTQSLDFDEATQTSEIGIDAMQLAFRPAKSPGASRSPWYVISYDQRGHGDSGGNVNIMDPAIEGKDMLAVMDWAEKNLPHLAVRSSDKRPVVGTIGRSYGGAFQLMGAGFDSRIRAMVPGGTWYDLRYSLLPGNVPKTSYLDGLVAVGAQSIRGRFEPYIAQALVDANVTGVVSPDTIKRLGGHGTAAYCKQAIVEDFPVTDANGSVIVTSDSNTWKQIPALFVQGAKDVLFNLNEGVQNFECYRATSPESKLLMVKYGHNLDSLHLQTAPGNEIDAKYAFNESKIWLKTSQGVCPAGAYQANTGRCVVQLKDLMFEFLATQMLGSNVVTDGFLGKKPSPLPTITAVIDDAGRQPTAVEIASKVPVGNTLNSITSRFDTQVVSGTPAVPTNLLASFTDAAPYSSQFASFNNAAMFTKVSNPIAGTAGKCFVGTPNGKITVASALPVSSPEDPILMVGLVLDDGSKQTILHDQIVPVKGYKTTANITLPGISVKVPANGNLRVVVLGYSPFFLANFNRLPNLVNVSANIQLPPETACP